MTLTYKNWDGNQKTWNPATEGFYFLRVSEKIENADGSYYNQSTMGRFSTVEDVQTAWHAILCVRPELKGKILPVKAPCAWAARETYVPVDRW